MVAPHQARPPPETRTIHQLHDRAILHPHPTTTTAAARPLRRGLDRHPQQVRLLNTDHVHSRQTDQQLTHTRRVGQFHEGSPFCRRQHRQNRRTLVPHRGPTPRSNPKSLHSEGDYTVRIAEPSYRTADLHPAHFRRAANRRADQAPHATLASRPQGRRASPAAPLRKPHYWSQRIVNSMIVLAGAVSNSTCSLSRCAVHRSPKSDTETVAKQADPSLSSTRTGTPAEAPGAAGSAASAALMLNLPATSSTRRVA